MTNLKNLPHSPLTVYSRSFFQTARVFLIDAYEPPFAAKLEFDAQTLAETVAQMNANDPYVAVVYGSRTPPGHEQSGTWWKTDVRMSSLGAFAACLYGHVQVTSVHEGLLDAPEELRDYKVLYLAPIENVRVRFAVPEGKRVRNVTLLVEMPYHQQQTGSILEVLIPRMETYQAVRMDLE